jgi:hypothetical protein
LPALALLVLATQGGAQERPAALAAPAVRMVDTIELDPHRFDTGFGGISGIDYDVRRRRLLLLSDDRSDHAPARFYTARLARAAHGHWRVTDRGSVALRDARGAVFPSAGQGREAVDPEAVRVAPDGRRLIWSSEGDINHGYGPAIRWMDRQGRTQGQAALPANLAPDPTGRSGPRDNRTIEGLDFTPDGALWLAMEAPLIEDGLPAGDDRGALVRFTRLEAAAPTRQFAYRLDAVPPRATGKDADNGVSEILALDDRRMLVLERSGAPIGGGRYRFHCRLYLADFTAATDVAAVARLEGAAITVAAKRLLIDFDDLPGDMGNLEGMAWWPSPRRDRIVLVNDNNFVEDAPTRLIILALNPALPAPAP